MEYHKQNVIDAILYRETYLKIKSSGKSLLIAMFLILALCF